MADKTLMDECRAIVRREIKASGLSQYALAKRSGVPQACISRAASDEHAGMDLTTALNLLDYFGWELRRKQGLLSEQLKEKRRADVAESQETERRRRRTAPAMVARKRLQDQGERSGRCWG